MRWFRSHLCQDEVRAGLPCWCGFLCSCGVCRPGLPCSSAVVLWSAMPCGLPCLSAMLVRHVAVVCYASVVCRAGLSCWSAVLVCRAGLPCWSAVLVCRAGVPCWSAHAQTQARHDTLARHTNNRAYFTNRVDKSDASRSCPVRFSTCMKKWASRLRHPRKNEMSTEAYF